MLNSGASMFFTFIKMTIVYLLLRFIITDGFNLVTNFLATYCNDSTHECEDNSFARASIFNKVTPEGDSDVMIVDILNLVTVVFSIIYFLVYHKYQSQIYSLLDSSAHTQDDYTVFVQNIPVYMAVSKNNKGQFSFEYEMGLKKIFEDAITEWIYQLKNQSAEESNELDKQMLKIMETTPNFDSLPKVTSVSLCFDLTEMETINQQR